MCRLGQYPLAYTGLTVVHLRLPLDRDHGIDADIEADGRLSDLGHGVHDPCYASLGMIYPVENMPAILRWISNIIPARWYIAAVKDLMIKGLGVQSVLKEISILLVMAAVLIAISEKL
jgi:hypothetical protein